MKSLKHQNLSKIQAQKHTKTVTCQFSRHCKLTTPKLNVSSLTETSPLKASGAMYADVPSTVVVGIVTVLLCCPSRTNPKSPSLKKKKIYIYTSYVEIAF